MNRRLDVAIAWGLVVAIAFSGLAHGAVEPWSIASLQILLIVLLELWALRVVVQRRLRLVLPAAALPLGGLIIFGLVQSISWTGADGRRMSLSIDVDLTRSLVFILVLLLGAFLVSANFWTSRSRLKSFGWFVTIFGFAFALFALIQGFTWNERFYWIRPAVNLTAPYGPFPSHNNYAGYIELFIPIAAAVALNVAVSRPARMFAGFAAVIMSLSVIFSLSRGGMISLAAGLVFFGVVSFQTARQRRKAWEAEEWENEEWDDADEGAVVVAPWWQRAVFKQSAVVVAIVGAILIGLLWLGPDLVANRLTQGTLSGNDPQGQNFYANRGWLWKDTWTMFKANPILGVGLGAFQTAFPIYTTNDGSLRVSWAHNDYLQLLSDGGVIGGLLAIWFVVAVFRAFGSGLKARDPWQGAMVLGAGAGIFSLLVHSIFDFNLQITSTALLFLVMAGIVGGVAQAVESKERQAKGNAMRLESKRERRSLAAA